VDLITAILTDTGMTQTGHILLICGIVVIYRRVSRLERTLERIALHTGALAALFEYDKPTDQNPMLDGREP